MALLGGPRPRRTMGRMSAITDGGADAQERQRLIAAIIDLEWGQFQRTTNQGGRAACQGNHPMFEQMRFSQFATWPHGLLASYHTDLADAEREGRNLVTEKYARMMASTDPETYARELAPYLPELTAERTVQQERIIAQQVAWAHTFMQRWPKLGAAMRVLSTAQDTPEQTSFETYLRGELSTYSPRTLALYGRCVDDLARAGRNLTEETVGVTVRLAGFSGLDEAERAQ